MVNIKDVARRASVSLGTVSNVINRPNVVSAETRARVLAAIAGILGEHAISIESVLQKGRGHAQGGAVWVVMMTHEARERSVRKALQAIATLPTIQGETVRVRVEEAEEE